MTDSYLSIAAIANDNFMYERVLACVTQQAQLDNVPNIGVPHLWVGDNRYLWAASPSWGEKWSYALETHTEDPDYEPGKDEAVITDADILATVQELGSG